MGDNENKPYKPVDGELIYASVDNNELPGQNEDFFKSVYNPNEGEASGSQAATEDHNKNMSERETRDPINKEQETKTVPSINEQQIKENEIDFGRNTAAIIILQSSMPSRL